MSELVPSLIPLDKGLNLQTAKLVAPAGSVLDTLNYEQVDFQGQKRIDGFVRYDGSLLAILDDFYRIGFDTDFLGTVGDYVFKIGPTDDPEDWERGDGLIGTVVNVNESTIDVAIIDYNNIPSEGDLVFGITGPTVDTPLEVSSVVLGVNTDMSEDEHYAALLAYSDVLRERVEELPGNIIGLHWFRDRLYAVADVTAVSLDGITPVIYPNDQLNLLGGESYTVLDSYVRDNTRLVFLSALDPAPWHVQGNEVFRDSISVGEVATGFEPFTPAEEFASFFESRTEYQAMTEDEGDPEDIDYGWRFVHQGWLVNFEEGLSLFGSLPSLNQNISDLGVQGPTTITAQNGMPMVLTQKVNLSDSTVQVNGWKSSQTPETYELETDNLIDTDDDTIYADAYVSWNGTTSEVVGITTPLVEYPATNTIIVELP